MEDAASFPYFLLSSTSSDLDGENQAQNFTSGVSMASNEISNTVNVSIPSHAFSDTTTSSEVTSFSLTSSTPASMPLPSSTIKDNEDTIPLTAVPVVFASNGQMSQIIKIEALEGNESRAVTVQHAAGVDVGALSVTQSGDFPVLFQASTGCTIDMLNTLTDVKSDMALLQPAQGDTVVTTSAPVLPKTDRDFNTNDLLVTRVLLPEPGSMTDVKPDMALLQPVQGGSVVTTSAPILSKTDGEFNTNDLLVTRVMLSEAGSFKADSETNCAIDVQCVGRNTADLPSTLSENHLSLSESVQDKPQEEVAGTDKGFSEDVNSLGTNIVLKTNHNLTTLPMVLPDTGGSMEMESTVAVKSEDSSSIFPEGAVLVETPQGLMLSVGDELRAVTLTEGPNSSGNQLLSISNNCIPVALLSQCQQGDLMGEQGGEVVYEAGGEGEVGTEGPIVCSTELPLVTQQVLTLSTPEDEEPKKKNRGWPKGKKRKTEPEVHGPRAPMTGYVLFAINRRQEIKQSHPHLPFTEVTKILGQEWSNMPMEKKQKYLDESENDKQRYIDELKQFQASEVYQTLVKKKRLKVDDETADDGDEIEDDSDELHCKVCKLYFSSLHNKKEHLLGRQHLLAITYQLKKELKKQQKEQETDLRGATIEMGLVGDTSGSLSPDARDRSHSVQCNCQTNKPLDVNNFILDFIQKNSEREQEIVTLRRVLRKDVHKNWSICKQIQELKDYENKLRQDLKNLSAHASVLSGHIHTLKMVPALFGVVDF